MEVVEAVSNPLDQGSRKPRCLSNRCRTEDEEKFKIESPTESSKLRFNEERFKGMGVGGCENLMEINEDEDFLTKRNLIVNYLPQTFTDVELYNMFIPFGALDSVRIMKDTKTGYSFGFGFVNFIEEEEAVEAQSAMNGFEVATKKIKVSFARPPSDDIKHTNLYITNLPRNITEFELVNIFKPFGTIIQKKLLRDKYTNLPRGVAFIRYEKRTQASVAIMALNNTMPEGCNEPIRIRLAEDHGKQKAAYLAGFQAGMVVPRAQDAGKWRNEKSRSQSKNKRKQCSRYPQSRGGN